MYKYHRLRNCSSSFISNYNFFSWSFSHFPSNMHPSFFRESLNIIAFPMNIYEFSYTSLQTSFIPRFIAMLRRFLNISQFSFNYDSNFFSNTISRLHSSSSSKLRIGRMSDRPFIFITMGSNSYLKSNKYLFYPEETSKCLGSMTLVTDFEEYSLKQFSYIERYELISLDFISTLTPSEEQSITFYFFQKHFFINYFLEKCPKD